MSLTYIGMFNLTKEQVQDLLADLEAKRREYDAFFNWLRSHGRESFKLIFHGMKTVDEIISILSAKIEKNKEKD